ncbi:HD-GYP domain-containing protein [Thermodesulfobacteriota bacterium]
MAASISIDDLIEIVRKGGTVRTGVDVYNKRDILLLEKDVLVNSVNILLILKQNGLLTVPVDLKHTGGIWDAHGKMLKGHLHTDPEVAPGILPAELDKKIREINLLKAEAKALQDRAKKNVKKVITSIKDTGGEFDQQIVEDTVDDIFAFLTKSEHAFSYLTKELFSYDDYLYNHSVNVCTLGIAILKRYNDHFGEIINKHLNSLFLHDTHIHLSEKFTSYILYYPEELRQIAIGFFLHDIGKVLLPEQVLNKEDRLTDNEYDLIKTHSTELGLQLIRKNMIFNIYVENVIKYHHAPLFESDDRSYPLDKLPIEVPPYVKICKLVDIYDAMTSKRSYKEAFSPIVVVTEIFRRFARKDVMLQIVLYSFMRVVGIYPPGSIVYLQNGQLAYIIESHGPVYIPFTDPSGNPLPEPQQPVDLQGAEISANELQIDRRRPPIAPKDVYEILPAYLKAN